MEFFAEKVQRWLMEYGIKFRPNKPGSPHLNGKVERSQRQNRQGRVLSVPIELFFCEYLASPPVIGRGLIYRAIFKLAEIVVVLAFIDNLHVTLSP